MGEGIHVIGYTEGSATDLGTLVASGGSDGSEGLLLIVLMLLAGVFVVAVSIVNRFRQPFVVVLEHPFRFLMKTIMVGVMTATVTVTLISIIIATAGSPT
ncbi:hypothetical protein KIH74_02735 [Kineosporia sp. J2-2]|uniref:Uncharacterized protein n=1 Tax=Kineosporia corallincola TaxID=2835133 RepID=A0ABS5T9T4_9ACTN|nr:hypothetical protein [Kineosporia corallincola]MBT0767821.1 hypothetical protein [Kineosporia corallincola]